MSDATAMQLGMIGLGRMGANMVRRILAAGHSCVVYDRDSGAVEEMATAGAAGAASVAELARCLKPPRRVWVMVPAAVVDPVIDDLVGVLEPGDVIIDGGNSHYKDALRRAAALAEKKLHFVDVGTSGGVWGLERGYCLMIGGGEDAVRGLDPIFRALAPGRGAIERTPGRERRGGTVEEGYLHCGGSGAGHFVKMVHNGIEYGMMAAYAEGLNVLAHAGAGARAQEADAETAPLRNPEEHRYELDLADITELWRRGSVITSWLLDLTAQALLGDPQLDGYAGRVADSGEGRWTVQAAVEQGTPLPVLSAALFQRFASRGEADFADKVLSAMRHGFGGHVEKKGQSGGRG
jgi:6-phosphogluconate dehydrogenase